MKNILCVIIAVCLCAPLAYCQNNFSIGLTLDGNLNKLGIERADNATLPVNLDEVGMSGHGLSAGVQLVYNVSNAFFIRSGLQYQRSKYSRELYGVLFDPNANFNEESIIENRIIQSGFGLPLEAGYRHTLKNEKLHLLFGGGARMDIDLIVESRGNLKPEPGAFDLFFFGVQNPLGQGAFSGKLFTGIEWDFSEKLALGVEAYGRYHFRKIIPTSTNFEGRSLVEPGMTTRLLYRI